jgi:glycosyltransferase involved in cell wall biosynthesis
LKSICFVVTTPFTANAFLLEHIKKLSLIYKVTLCLNLKLYPLSPNFDLKKIQIIDVPIERKINLLKDCRALLVLLSIFKKERFDVVHTVSPKAGLLGIMAGYLSQIKNRFHTFTGQVWVNLSNPSKAFFKAMDRLICKMATQVFADSQSQIDFLVTEGICKKSEISLLGCGSISGVNLARFKPDAIKRSSYRKALSAQDGDIIFLFVGRVCRDKGIFDLFAAFNEIYTNFGKKVYLWVVGPDEGAVVPELEVMYSELANQVKWIGPSFEPESYMAAADILVLPSYREGFGSVVIEAAACSIPAITYVTEGITDAIENNRTGLLARKYDIKDLVLKMDLLVANVDLRIQLGENAYERAITLFSSDAITAEWLTFYKKLLHQ